MIDLLPLLDDGGLTLAGVTFSENDSEQLGRAMGTLGLRLGLGQLRFALGYAASTDMKQRDGLVRGLVLSGHDVLDVGQTSEPSWAQAATEPETTAGIFLGAIGEVPRFRLMLGGALNADRRTELAAVFAEGRFAAGEGSLVVLAHGQGASL